MYHKKYYNVKEDEDKISIYTNEGRYWEYHKSIQPRLMKSIFINDEIKTNILTDLENFYKPETKEMYKQCGITWKRIYMFHGLPGTGKSSLVKALASTFNKSISIITSDANLKDSDYIKLFSTIEKDSFVLIEDIDGLFNIEEENKQNSISFSTLLNSLDGAMSSEFVCFITTNNIKTIKKSLIRPGRIDFFQEFSYLSKPEITTMFKVFTKNRDDAVSSRFYSAIKHMKLTGALLQNYLFKYLNKPEDAISNISELTEIMGIVNETEQNLYN